MKRISRFLLCLLLVVPSCGDRLADTCLKDTWDPQVREALNDLMKTSDKGFYAVFDFDKTSIVHDISQALWVYQIEHLCYADAPAHDFLDGITTPTDLMPGTTLSYAAMGDTMSKEFQALKARQRAGETLESIHQSAEYLDFRARMYSFMMAMDDQYGSWVTYLWMPGLLAGYTEMEAEMIIRDAIAEHLGREKVAVESWISPDGCWGGNVERGIWVSPQMKELYKCLAAAGIDIYVCSASLELIVEVLACDPELGFGLPANRVYGLRFVRGEKIVAQFDSAYDQPCKEGKVDNIRNYMAPAHGGVGPILVAGDSNGDVPMLTSFPEMKHGLIIDVGRSPESPIGQLAAQARAERNQGRYLLQPSFEQYN